jgi:hypothetical protein
MRLRPTNAAPSASDGERSLKTFAQTCRSSTFVCERKSGDQEMVAALKSAPAADLHTQQFIATQVTRRIVP